MKMSLQEARQLVGEVVAEARKKKKASEEQKPERVPHPPEYRYAEALDFSKPLSAWNLYHQEGQANMGGWTDGAAGGKIDDRLNVQQGVAEQLVHEMRTGQLVPMSTAWSPLSESSGPEVAPTSIWNEALHWYAHAQLGLGKPGALGEAHLGFKKLKGKLAHKKGVKDPAALAASIGRKKYGAKGMAKKAAAGRRK